MAVELCALINNDLTKRRYLLVIRQPKSTRVNWTAYLEPFTATTWISVILIVLIESLSVSLTNWAFVRLVQKSEMNRAPLATFGENVLEIAGSLCTQGNKLYSIIIIRTAADLSKLIIIINVHLGIQPSKIEAVRSIHYVIHITSITVLAAYSAALVSFLTVQSVSLPFSSLQGLIEDKTYRLGIVKDSAEYTHLRVSNFIIFIFFLFIKKKKRQGWIIKRNFSLLAFQDSEDITLKTVYNNYLSYDYPKDVHSGLNKVCKSEKFAFMIKEHWVKMIERNLSCTLYTLDVAWITHAALQTTKSNPFREAMNQL